MTVTIFVPLMGGLYDNEYGPHIYEGKLTREQMLAIGSDLGSCYPACAIEGNDEDGYHVTYNNDLDVKPHPTEGGFSFFETEGQGELSYSVEFHTVVLLKGTK